MIQEKAIVPMVLGDNFYLSKLLREKNCKREELRQIIQRYRDEFKLLDKQINDGVMNPGQQMLEFEGR